MSKKIIPRMWVVVNKNHLPKIKEVGSMVKMSTNMFAKPFGKKLL